MKGFNFFKSYYEAASHLSDEDQALFYKTIMDYMFKDIEPQLDGALMGFWLLIKPNLDTSKSRANAGQTKSKANQKQIKSKTNMEKSPPKEKEKEKEKEKDKGVIPSGINIKAWGEFETHRKQIRKPMSLLARTKLFNILLENIDDQEYMINNSIANGWAGLFPRKEKEQEQVGGVTW